MPYMLMAQALFCRFRRTHTSDLMTIRFLLLCSKGSSTVRPSPSESKLKLAPLYYYIFICDIEYSPYSINKILSPRLLLLFCAYRAASAIPSCTIRALLPLPPQLALCPPVTFFFLFLYQLL